MSTQRSSRVGTVPEPCRCLRLVNGREPRGIPRCGSGDCVVETAPSGTLHLTYMIIMDKSSDLIEFDRC